MGYHSMLYKVCMTGYGRDDRVLKLYIRIYPLLVLLALQIYYVLIVGYRH